MDASAQIDQQIAKLADWRGELMKQLRALIHEADPEIKEEWKWGTGVMTHGGMVCALNGFKDHVKMNFFQGAALEDPHGLFNSGLDAQKMRSIDFHRGDTVDEAALVELVRAAVNHNLGR